MEEEEIASFFQHVYEVKRRRERKCLRSVKTAAETVRTYKGGGGEREFVSTKKSGKTNYGSYKTERKLFSALPRERKRESLS